MISSSTEKKRCWRNKHENITKTQPPPRHADAQIRLHLIEGTRALLGYLEEATGWQLVGSVGWGRLDGLGSDVR